MSVSNTLTSLSLAAALTATAVFSDSASAQDKPFDPGTIRQLATKCPRTLSAKAVIDLACAKLAADKVASYYRDFVRPVYQQIAKTPRFEWGATEAINSLDAVCADIDQMSIEKPDAFIALATRCLKNIISRENAANAGFSLSAPGSGLSFESFDRNYEQSGRIFNSFRYYLGCLKGEFTKICKTIEREVHRPAPEPNAT